ncbi:MAG TPA: tetratricopeptide repeat protein [Gammaproteobacteria bacterium]|nr:tetratricopeptide repeat protein [Gammaproteobacteria bacterium]
MDDRLYKTLKYVAIVLTLSWVGWAFYDSFLHDVGPGQRAFQAGERAFADGEYASALQDYDEALHANHDLLPAVRGRARSLMQLGRLDESLAAFDRAIAAKPEFAASYANRGIVYDRMGDYQAALADYEHALKLDPKLADGPNWLTRFLRLQPDKPPTIADRARYLRAELAKPPGKRVLRMPEIDAKQRPYKQ